MLESGGYQGAGFDAKMRRQMREEAELAQRRVKGKLTLPERQEECGGQIERARLGIQALEAELPAYRERRAILARRKAELENHVARARYDDDSSLCMSVAAARGLELIEEPLASAYRAEEAHLKAIGERARRLDEYWTDYRRARAELTDSRNPPTPRECEELADRIRALVGEQ